MFRTFLLCLTGATILFAQDPAPEPAEPPAPPANRPAANPPGRGGAGAAANEPQPYDKVITKDAKSTKGIFSVHEIKDRYYFEIPKDQLDREFLLNIRVSKTTLGVGYGGDQMNDLVVRWELSGNKVHLRNVNYRRHGRSRIADRRCREGIKQRHDSDDVQCGRVFERRRSGDRYLAPLFKRRSRVQRAAASQCPGHGRIAFLH